MVQEIEKCYGCTACMHRCPSDAINMCNDAEGFSYAIIDRKKCTDCGMCLKICNKHEKILKKNFVKPECFYGWSADIETRLKSSSGGVFSLLAEFVLAEGGVVFGAAFDYSNELRHVAVDNLNDLPKLRGSKYLQSSLEGVFPEVKRLLLENRQVLFSGTPCQVAGLYLFLDKDFGNLLTIDVLCNSVGSPKAFAEYLAEIKPANVANPEISFRDKSRGFQGQTVSLRQDGNVLVMQENQESPYVRGYLETLFCRPCCSHCKYTKDRRVGDISLGDFWGLGEFDAGTHAEQASAGVSLLLVNNPKGALWLNKVKRSLEFCKSTPLQYAKISNSMSVPHTPHPGRAHFFANLGKKSFGELVDESLSMTQRHVGLLNFCYGEGYGQVLMNYALSNILAKYGYTSEVLNYIPQKDRFMEPKKAYEDFRSSYLMRTSPCSDPKSLERRARRCGTIIAGSDVVWLYHRDFVNFLYWAHGYRRLVAYAPSFGSTKFEGNDNEKDITRKLLARFDAISVRESSGVGICENTFGLKGVHVLDPTLLLDEEDYQPIIDKESAFVHKDGHVLTYFLDLDRKDEFYESDFGKILKGRYDIVSLDGRGDVEPVSVGQWLQHISSAEIVLTDSYHCVLFSIIYKKPFIFFSRDVDRGHINERLFSLFDDLGINAAHHKKDFDISPDFISTHGLDYSVIYERIKTRRRESLKFLQNALQMEIAYKESVPDSLVAVESLEVVIPQKKWMEILEEMNRLREDNIKLKMLVDVLKKKAVILGSKDI